MQSDVVKNALTEELTKVKNPGGENPHPFLPVSALLLYQVPVQKMAALRMAFSTW